MALAAAGTSIVLYGAASLTVLGEEPVPSAVEMVGRHEAARTSEPARIRIPALEVDAAVAPLGLMDDGSLEVPEFDEAGWWSDGARPGDPGPTVIVAHRDSTTGPALFYGLPSIEVGADIWVTDHRGVGHLFRVDRVERHRRDAFPTEAVYGATPRSSLRLLTCGGDYDAETGYEDNYVVFASSA